MTNDELDRVVLCWVGRLNGRATVGWVEAQVRATYEPEQLWNAPAAFDVRDSVWRLVEAGRLCRGPRYQLSLSEGVQ